MTENQKNNQSKKQLILKIIIPIFTLSMICAAGAGSFLFVREKVIGYLAGNTNSSPEFSSPSMIQKVDEQGRPLPPVDMSENSSGKIELALEPWDGAGRVTVLLLGLDYRDWSADVGPSRSDTMILLTLDPLSSTAGILSIPRDMWVAIPGFKHGKINTAHALGEAYDLPGGGPGLAVDTVEHMLGVPVNYYAQIDFDAFVRFIDEIGGVKLDVPEKIKIDLLGDGFKTIKTLQPGVQRLPGEWALAYARARNTEGGDFDRAFRQQQVILAIRDQILSWELLPTLIKSAPTLFKEISAGVNTNFNLDEVIKLALLAQSVPEENIQRGIIDKNYVIFGTSPDGLSILIPLQDKIHLLRDQIFTTFGLGPETPGDSRQRMETESASTALYDGSGAPEILVRTENYFRSQGMNISQSSPAGEPYARTIIIDHSGSPHILQYLVETMDIKPTNIRSEFDPNHAFDVEIYLGSDWALNNTLP